MSPIEPQAVSGPLPEYADVVVVGAGAAGCVVASRLSEDPGRSVLLLEAGELTDAAAASVPGDTVGRLGDDPAVVPEPTTPQPGLGGRSVPVLVGRALGGGSAVNNLTWFQGHPEDYDGWAAAGARGWGWDEVLPVLRRIENHALGPDEHHGAGGPITVSTSAHFESLHLDFLAAGEQAGLPVSDDLNGARRCGVGLNQANVRDGRRHGVLDGYLVPALGRANLTVRIRTAVERVLVDGRRATGVRVAGRTVRAGRVVLAAGTLRTPQLLMLSGVGPAGHLREHGIEVVHDLPGVGENLHDHVIAAPSWPVHGRRTGLDAHDEASLTAYRLVRRGPLSTVAPVTAMLALGDSTAPDIGVLPVLLALDGVDRVRPEPGMTPLTCLLTPHSRGRLRLRSARPDDPPDVDPAYLDAPEDLERLRAGVQRVSELFATPALRGATGPRRRPDPDVDDAELDAWLRENATSFWHPAGTARMGTDAGSVVDPGLAVHGVESLWVADGSVMPAVTRGNTHAPCIMIGERAAGFLAEG